MTEPDAEEPMSRRMGSGERCKRAWVQYTPDGEPVGRWLLPLRNHYIEGEAEGRRRA